MNKLSFLLNKLKTTWYWLLIKISAVIPRNSALRNVLAAIFHPYNKAVKPLLDIDVLNERIKNVKDLAESNTVSNKKFFIIERKAPTERTFILGAPLLFSYSLRIGQRNDSNN